MRVESDLERQQRDLQSQIDSVAQHLVRERDCLRRRIVSLYRLGRLSYVRLLLAIDERRDPIEAMSMLTYLASREARAITRFNSEPQQLRLRYAEMAERQKKIVEARQIIQQRQESVAATHARQEHLVAMLRRERSKSRPQLTTLEENA